MLRRRLERGKISDDTKERIVESIEEEDFEAALKELYHLLTGEEI